MFSSWPFFEPTYVPRARRYVDPLDLMEQDLSASAARAFNALNAFSNAFAPFYDDAQMPDAQAEAQPPRDQALQDADMKPFEPQGSSKEVSAPQQAADGEAAGGQQRQLQVQPQQQQKQQQVAPYKPASMIDWINQSAGALSMIPRDKSYDISIDVPGVPKEQLKVQIKDHPSGRKLLHVSGERKQETATSFTMNKVSRSVLLPSDIDASANLSANYEHGVLKLSVPKSIKALNSCTDVPIA